VTVYGIADIGYSDAEVKTTAADGSVGKVGRTSTGNGDGALSTSRLGFRGSEDLGGGNKANFVLEYDLVDVGSGANGFGARYSWVGLESKELGQIRLGRQESSAHSVVCGSSAGGCNNVAGAMYSGNQAPNMLNPISARPHEVFLNSVVTYIAPKIGGLTVEVQYGQGKDTTEAAGEPTETAKANASGASLKYTVGKLNLGYAFQEIKGSVTADNDDKTTSHVFSANYDLGMVKLFALHGEVKVRNNLLNPVGVDLDRKDATTEIGVQVPMGKTMLWASMFDGDRKTSTDPAAPESEDTSGFQLGVRYDLSKRTNLYAIYGEQERKSTGLVIGGRESTGLAAGVRHSF
jgi:predicted porin